MKTLLLAAVLAASSLSLIAVQTGDSLETVLAEKGQPTNRLQAGPNTILTYHDGSIKIRDNKVVAIRSAKELAEANVKGVPPSTPRTAPAVRPAPASAEVWGTDYAAALAQARSEGKQVFLLFTGSDWCVWCKRLEGEILSTPEFKEYAAAKLILVKLDFPRHTPQSDQLKAQNTQLAQQNGIRGYPTVVILDSSGKRIGTLGYVKGGPAGFISKLQSF
jgi:thiol-disulfide isomerase/thioredoxin